MLKKQWHRQDDAIPRLSYAEIYSMLLKKSSSIVKWILFISIGEICLWSSLAFLVPESSRKFTEEVGLDTFMLISNIIYYIVFIAFILIFYKNYKKISATDSVKELMNNILRTRRTVNYFIIYNLVSATMMLLSVNIFYYTHKELVFQLMVENYGTMAQMNQAEFFKTFFIIQAVFGLGMLVVIILFYRFVYGTLLRRLKRNHQELKEMEE